MKLDDDDAELHTTLRTNGGRICPTCGDLPQDPPHSECVACVANRRARRFLVEHGMPS